MAEWPKVWDLTPVGPKVRVIPADLGRELYDALRRQMPSQYPSGDKNIERMRRALTHYEQEVGE